MRKSRHKEEQMTEILEQQEAGVKKAADLCRDTERAVDSRLTEPTMSMLDFIVDGLATVG
jgi:hypothetical protein